MAINATNTAPKRELTPSGNYIGRCYQMVEIGTVKEVIKGIEKIQTKVRIGWELPTELKVFKEERGPQPRVVSAEYTLSLHEKANLRKMLAGWRGIDFTPEQAKVFDITKLLGVPCMINIIHKPSKDGSSVYEEISGVTAIPKGIEVPKQITPTFVLSYDAFDDTKFDSLPDFIKDKMKGSTEFLALKNPGHTDFEQSQDSFSSSDNDQEDLPF